MSKKKNKKLQRALGKEKKPMRFFLPEEIKRKIGGILAFLLAIIIALSFIEQAGWVGRKIGGGLESLFGRTFFLLPLVFVLSGLVFFLARYRKFLFALILAVLLFIVGTSGIFGILNLEIEDGGWPLANGLEGGWLGHLTARSLFQLFGFWVGLIIFSGIISISGLIFWHLLAPPFSEKGKEIEREGRLKEEKTSLITRIFKRAGPSFKMKEVESPPAGTFGEIKKEKEIISEPSLELKTQPINSAAKNGREREYQRPPLELLDSEKEKPTAGDTRTNSAIIKKTLENFEIPVEMSGINVGPTVTQYTLKPADGIKLSKITTLSNDLALALASHPIRIEAPIPGKPLVGIEVPNRIRAQVRLRELVAAPQFQNSFSSLSLVLGRDVSGNPVYTDLSRMPHLLVAGSTGTGKTLAADTLMFTEKGMLNFEELCSLSLNSETDFKIKLITRDGIEETAKNYNNGICQFYKLTTRRGYQVEATAEHPLWVINQDGSQSWKQASLIKKGDYVAISRGPALFGNKVDLSGFKPSEIKAYHRKISFPSKMTPRLAEFLGLLTADGGLSIERKGIHRAVYTQADPGLIRIYKKHLKELFNITQFIEKRTGSNPKNKAKDIEVNSKHLKEFLAYLGMDSAKSPHKQIPKAIREAPRETVSAYLRAVFDNDGYVGKNSIELCISSRKLASQSQIMLLNFGMISSLSIKKVKNYADNKYYKLSIYGQEARKFIQEVGFIRKEKYNRAKKLLGLSSNPNLDLIPNISSLLKRMGQKYLNSFARLTNRGWKYQPGILIPKHAFNSLNSYNSGERMPGYQSLEKILNFYQPISQELEHQELKKISQRNFYWDKIEEIDRTSGVGYDFFVPGSDSFVGNGLVNHNTIFLNSLILSLLYRNSPETLRLILIDPKRVEFSVYKGLPHLLSPVIFDAQKTINALKWLIAEMERRFNILSGNGSRDITSYNEKISREGEPPVPYIILIVDELADLMAARGREMEAGIVRLAQMARAVGIHLVVATQRPSVEVITGLIKANITSRITFQVASQVDSRTVLDMAGAEKLLGAGDLLFISAEIAKPKRIQGAYVSEKEVRKVVNWLETKVAAPAEDSSCPSLTEEILEQGIASSLFQGKEGTEFDMGEDPLYEEAKRVVIEARKASASLLQRRLRIGYARAARLIDILEERGIVGPGEGAKPREIYLSNNNDNKISNDNNDDNDNNDSGEWEKV